MEKFQFILASLQYQWKRWPELCFALFCFLIIRWHKKYKNQLQWPIIDVLPPLLRNVHRFHDWTVDMSNKYGSTIMARGPVFGRLDILFTCNPENIDYVLKINAPNFVKGPDFCEAIDILGEGIFSVDDYKWNALRRMAHKIFVSKEFRSFTAKVSRKVVEDAVLPLMAQVAGDGSVVDLENVFLRYSFDSIYDVIFGRNSNNLTINSQANKELAQAIDDGTEAIFYRLVTPVKWWKFLRWLGVGNEKKMAQASKTIDLHLARCIAIKREELLKEGERRRKEESGDLLSRYLITARYLQEEGGGGGGERKGCLLSKADRFLRDTALSFLFAGRDSTATSLAWFFWLITKNPHVEANIMEELTQVFLKEKRECADGVRREKRPWVFDSEDLKGLVYLHAALCESLRLYPPLPLTGRGAIKEDMLPDGSVVKPGTKIVLSIYAMGRMDWLWGKDCLEFRPERWIDEKNRKLNPELMSKFYAFGVGPRTCLGREMGFTQMKMVATAILFNFQVEVVEGHIVYPKPSLVLHMKNGLKVRIKERRTWM